MASVQSDEGLRLYTHVDFFRHVLSSRLLVCRIGVAMFVAKDNVAVFGVLMVRLACFITHYEVSSAVSLSLAR